MSSTLLQSLTPEGLSEIQRQSGFRVETVRDAVGTPYLRSGTGGLGFDARFFNQLSGEQKGYADVALTAALRVQGELALEVINEWNNSRRFARLRLLGELLVLDMDISVLGGVTLAWLRTQLEIWDRSVGELIPSLQEAQRRCAAAGRNGAGSVTTAQSERLEAAVALSD